MGGWRKLPPHPSLLPLPFFFKETRLGATAAVSSEMLRYLHHRARGLLSGAYGGLEMYLVHFYKWLGVGTW